MSHRNHKLDMAGTLAAHFLFCNLYTTTVAHDALVTNALILTAGTLIILCRTEDTLTEEAIALRFISTIVDGLRLGNLTIRILKDFFR